MDPVTGIGLAASLATLAEIAGKSGKALYRFTKRFRNGPEALESLYEEVEAVRQLLDDISALVRYDLDDHDIGPQLRKLAQSKQAEMTRDLEAFETWVADMKKNFEKPGSSERHLRARFVKALSEREVTQHRSILAEHRKSLDTLLNQLANRQLCRLAKENRSDFVTVFAQFDQVQKRLDGIASEFVHSNPTLERIEHGLEDFEHRLIKLDSHLQSQRASSAYHDGGLNKQIQRSKRVAKRTQKYVWWNWSIFRLPIGTLSVETSEVVSDLYDDTEVATKVFQSSVNFLPAPWIADTLATVSNGVSLGARDIPKFWCTSNVSPLRSRNLVPSTFAAALRDRDPYEVSSCLKETNECILRLIFLEDPSELNSTRNHLEGFWPTLRITSVHKAIWGINVGQKDSRSISVSMHTVSDCWRSLPPEKSCAECRDEDISPTTERSIIYSCGPMLTGTTRPDFTHLLVGGLESRPTLIIPCSEEGFQFFLTDLLPHMDLSTFMQLCIVDKWWLTVLDYNDSRFGSAIRAELESYSSWFTSCQRSQRACKASVWPFFDSYGSVVTEVLHSRPLQRQNMLVLICAFGNSRLLKPFIDAGYVFNTPLLHLAPSFSSYVSVAASSQNIETLEILTSVGCRLCGDELIVALEDFTSCTLAETERVEKIIDLFEGSLWSEHLKRVCNFNNLSSPVHIMWPKQRSMFADDKEPPFLALLSAPLPPSQERDNSLVIRVYRKLCIKGVGHFTRPPYSRSMYLGPEIVYAALSHMVGVLQSPGPSRFWEDMVGVLLELGASLDYKGPEKASEKLSALEWSVELGYHRVIVELLKAEGNFEDFGGSVWQALQRAKACLQRRHPRTWPEQLSNPASELKDQYTELTSPEIWFYERHEETCGVSIQTDKRCVEILEEALESYKARRFNGKAPDTEESTSNSYDGVSRWTPAYVWREPLSHAIEKATALVYKIQRRAKRRVKQREEQLERPYTHPRAPVQDYVLAVIGLCSIMLVLLLHKLVHFGVWAHRQRHALRSFTPLFVILLALLIFWR